MANQKASVFQMGVHTLPVSAQVHKMNRDRLLERLRKDPDVPSNGIVVLMGGMTANHYNTDVEPVFIQESYFHWTFGAREPDMFGAIDLQSGKSYLFVARLDEMYAIWFGKLMTLEDIRLRYQVDVVHYVDDMINVLKKIQSNGVLLTLKGMNTDSSLETIEPQFDPMHKLQVNNKLLHDHMAELRVFKTPAEIDILRYANKISSEAHIQVMKSVRPGMNEYQLESIFKHYCYYNGGARHVAYTSICGCGPNSAVLHYGHAGAPNDQNIQDGQMCLMDMGCAYDCYSSDITTSFPANGKFTPEQRFIYETVLKANREVMKAAKPGVSWADLHLLAEKIELESLKNYGLLKGDLDEMMQARLGYIFMPHGLGHLMGIDVHDVGGYLDKCPQRSCEVGLKQLRTSRILEAGMVLTIEPGLYFIDAQLEAAQKDATLSQMINWQMMDKFRRFGGVRIEDDVVITHDGVDLLTQVPRTVDEIEKVMAEGRKIEVEFPQQKFMNGRAESH